MLVQIIMLSKVSQTQKELHCVLWNVEAYQEKRLMSERGTPQDDGREEGGESAQESRRGMCMLNVLSMQP